MLNPVDEKPLLEVTDVETVTLVPLSVILELVKLWCPAPFCNTFTVGKASEPLLPVTPVNILLFLHILKQGYRFAILQRIHL